MTVFMKKIRKKFASAIVQNNLIQDNDHILVAVSGGKDSLLMITFFQEMIKKYRLKYKITACHLKNEMTEPKLKEETAVYLESYFKQLDIPFVIQDLPTISSSDKDKKVGCFWCSWIRRKHLFDLAREMGIQKVALGHHKDDINETFLINLFYHGKLATMPIKLELFDGDLTIIRPMAYIDESDIKKAAGMMNLKISTCLCPYAGNTKRSYIKNLISEIEKEFKPVRNNLFSSLKYDKIDPTYLN